MLKAIPLAGAAPRARARVASHRRLPRIPAVFWIPLVAYLAAAVVTVVGDHNIVGDAWSRVGNAYYVFFSRDPHLAAIGFVWNPLPSLMVLPLLPLSLVWPSLVELGLAGNIVGALCMAAAVYQVHGALGDFGVGRRLRVVLTLVFALHPMIALYGANGMSEAPFLFFSILAARHLCRWLVTRNIASLAIVGIALGLGYLTRYEAAASGAAVVGLVALVSFARSRHDRGTRWSAPLADALIVMLPLATAFVVWSVTSWVVVGSPFETFTSIYGNSEQVGNSSRFIQEATGQGSAAAYGYIARQVIGIEPLFLGVLVAGAGMALRRRDPRILGLLAVFGTLLAFSAWAFVTGKTFGWLRFYIMLVPLVTLSTGLVLASLPALRLRAAAAMRLVRGATVMALLVLPVLAMPVAAITMFDARLAREEAFQLHPLNPAADLFGAQPQAKRSYEVAREVVGYLDELALPRGAVLIDVARGYPVVLQSKRPEQFVITPDRDFRATVADPAAFGVRYILVPTVVDGGQLDAVGRAHAGIYADGAGIARLEREFGSAGESSGWRLYTVLAQ